MTILVKGRVGRQITLTLKDEVSTEKESPAL